MMHNNQGQIVIRKAMEADVGQIAEIMVEDWKRAYNGIIDSAFLDAMSVEQRYPIEVQRYQKYMVATDGQEILGYAWNEMMAEESADCEIVALYVRYDRRKSEIGRMLFQNAMDSFRAAGKKTMIVWCLKENQEARKFYERMGGKADQTGTHTWGNRVYDMISYRYRLDEQSI